VKKYILGFFLLLILGILGLAALIFYQPTIIVNPKNMKWALEYSKVLKSFSWKEAEINHQYEAWNRRRLQGHFTDLCFEYENESVTLQTCLQKISWDFEAFYENAQFGEKTFSPFEVISPLTKVTLKPAKIKEDTGHPPQIYRYWKLFWGEVVPDMDISFAKIEILKDKKLHTLDFKLEKRAKTAEIRALDFKLTATPKEFTLSAPQKYPLPSRLPGFPPFYLRDFILKGEMAYKGLTLNLTGALEALKIKVSSYVDFPIKADLGSLEFRKEVLLNTKAQVNLVSLENSLQQMGPAPYTSLPAPLNAMDGTIDVDLRVEDEQPRHWVKFVILTKVNLEGGKQALKMDLSSDISLDLATNDLGNIILGLNFERVALQMPKLSKKELPPQLIPDSRIKNTAYVRAVKPTPKKRNPDMNFRVHALNEKAVHIMTNLLDEPIRINFDLTVKEGQIHQGFISLLPIKTSIFKRQIEIPALKITFAPGMEPVIKSLIIFKLPEYKISLLLEGPLSKPRHSISSIPSLPVTDIYAVLLFGRPMSALGADDKTAAQKTSHLVSQGILSLTVLYYFAGSPIQYIGYDPNTSNVTAQFGIGKKNSLYVTGSGQNVNATGVRRSLGKGWYLDTSVQNQQGISNSEARNYGVLLERIIAY
jgi:TamB, inner membrane protein subunit of TAM complex